MASMVFQTQPFFDSNHGDDRDEELRAIVRILGTKQFYEYQEKYKFELDVEAYGVVHPHKWVGFFFDFFLNKSTMAHVWLS